MLVLAGFLFFPKISLAGDCYDPVKDVKDPINVFLAGHCQPQSICDLAQKEEPKTQCINSSECAGIYPSKPVCMLVGAGASSPGPEAAKATAEALAKKKAEEAKNKLVVPKLNVAIPGLQFSDQAYVEGNQVYIPFLAQYINAFFKYILGVALVAAAIMLVWGGMLYLYGATGLQVSDAKKKMIDAIIGLIIILGAYVIVVNLNPNLASLGAIRFTRIDPQVWKSMESVNSDIPASLAASGSSGASSASKSVAAGTPVAGPCNAVDKVVNFKQAGGDWGNKPFGKDRLCTPGEEVEVTKVVDGVEQKVKVKASKTSNAGCCQPYGESACGMTSLADILASYGEKVDPGTVGDMLIKAGKRNCNYGGSHPATGLNTWMAQTGNSNYVSKNLDKDLTVLNQTLIAGHPVAFLCGNCRVCKAGKAGSPVCLDFGGHWMVLTGVYDNGTYGVSDPSKGDFTTISKDEILSTRVQALVLITPKDGHPINGCSSSSP